MLSKKNIWQILVLLWFLVGCSTPTDQSADNNEQLDLYRPEVELGQLFHDVQMSDIFSDSKSFVDYIPLSDPELVLTDYLNEKDKGGFDLKVFIEGNFIPPYTPEERELSELPPTIAEHIPLHWDYLTRQPRDEQDLSSLISLPFPYVVPGGRFREIYYWDSFFTMQGLAASGRWDLIESMLDNFAYLIDEVGFIPNGNRTYFLGRSQPPFFSSMVMLYAEGKGMESALKYLPQLVKEYEFWMDGANDLDEETPAYKRVVMPGPGTVLNRYWDDFAEPRPESYKEDVEMAAGLDEVKSEQLYRDIRAACESGWDFSSRWFEDGQSFDKIITTQILPVDLNSLLLHLESTIGLMHEEIGNKDLAEAYFTKAGIRGENILRYFWDDQTGYFQDYNYQKGGFTNVLSLAGMYPFYYNIPELGHMERAVEIIKSKFLYDGGLISTLNDTGQQWDNPNGWPPLHWISIVGLANYQQDELAFDISERWIELNQKVFTSTGKMMEKYNVTDLQLEAGGGEYPTQDGFGWTNGVVIKLIQILEASEVAELEEVQ